MHVATDLDGGFELEQHGLSEEDLSSLDGEVVDFGRAELDLLAWFVPSD